MNEVLFLEKALSLNQDKIIDKYNILVKKLKGGQLSIERYKDVLNTKNFKLAYYVVSPTLKILDIRPNQNLLNNNQNIVTPHFSKTKNNIETLFKKSDGIGNLLIDSFYLYHTKDFRNIMNMYANAITKDLLGKKTFIYNKDNLDLSKLQDIISEFKDYKRKSILYWIEEGEYVHITLIIIDNLEENVVLTLFDPNGTYSYFYVPINKLITKYNETHHKKIIIKKGSKRYQNETPPQMNLPLCQLYTMRMLLVEILNPNIHTLLLTDYLIRQTMASFEKFIIQSTYFLLYLLQLIRKHNPDIKSIEQYQSSYNTVVKVLHELNPEIKMKSLEY